MSKEVNRSLLLWPAVTSVAILALSCFPVSDEVDPAVPRPPHVDAVPHVAIVLNTDMSVVESEIELSARSEHGVRAMKLPLRVAEVFGVAKMTLKAPVRNDDFELAGLPAKRRRSPGGFDRETVESLLRDLAKVAASSELQQPVLFASSLTSSAPAENLLAGSQAKPQEAYSIDPAPGETDEAAPAWLVGPSQPEFWQPEMEIVDAENFAPRSMLPRSNRALGRREIILPEEKAVALTGPERQAGHSTTAAVAEPAGKLPVGARARKSPAGWPLTQRLSKQLEALSLLASHDSLDVELTSKESAGIDRRLVSLSTSASSIDPWSQKVAERLQELQSLSRLGDTRSGVLIDELAELAEIGKRQAEETTDRGQQVLWLQACHAIQRRVAVWHPVWQLSQTDSMEWTNRKEASSTASITTALEQVRIDLEETGDVSGWRAFLLIDEIQQASKHGDLETRTVLAQRFLSRLVWHGLDPEQAEWLKRDSVTELASRVRPWSHQAVDYANLLRQIEQQEANAIDLAALDVASAVQTLRFAENPDAVKVSEGINTYYRNANVRLAITETMLERMLPVIENQSMPLRTRILGNAVRGTSHIDSDLGLELHPSPDRWSLDLRTTGKIQTNSTAISGSVAVRTANRSSFEAVTPIEVTPRGVFIGDSGAEVSGHTRLRGIRSDYEGWPLVGSLVGSLVRAIAKNRYDSVYAETNRVGNRQIRSRVEGQIDRQLDERLDVAASKLSELVLGPLSQLQLDPQVTDMQTTDRRLLARYRLAGDWQLAASTPRPRALSSSLMSLQVHQSALNNTLEQLVPRDEPMLIREMIRNGAATFGQSVDEIPNDIPDDVTIQFARTRPITVEIEEGQLWLTLRVVRLSQSDRLNLTQFIVRAAYRAEVDGIQAQLVREGHLRISGPRMSMRERLPARAIFNKVLASTRPIRLTNPALAEHPAAKGLVVSQLELRNGWIAMAVSESDAPRIAIARTASKAN